MKKVRLAFAAATPVLGMVAVPAAAHAATTTAGTGAGTTSGRMHYSPGGTATRVNAEVLCYSQNVRANFNAPGTLRAEIIFGGNSCVAYQQARLDYAQTGYTERIRYRNTANQVLRSDYIGGTISGNATYWSSRPNIYAYEVCAALVPNNNHAKVVWGPVCNFTDA